MVNSDFFKEDFYKFAINGSIGDPNGEIAFGYIRVSSSGQAEEGRSGLPRQIENIHKVAEEKGYRIPWEMVYSDDDSGFEFKQRNGLSNLRNECKSTKRKADTLIIEDIDRLSRNSKWHQGFLLDEFENICGMNIIFFDPIEHEIVRAAKGFSASETMKKNLERMHEGTIKKAEDGRVTAKTPAFGYNFTLSDDNQTDVRKFTQYEINEEKSFIVKYIFESVAYKGMSLRSLATELDGKFPTPKNKAHWEQKQLALMIRNPVYKGEFVANRVKCEKIWVDPPGKFREKRTKRPKEEWIIVPVPAIVNPELWELANKMLNKNKKMGRRNAKEPYLLTGLTKCATCDKTYVGGRKTKKKPNGKQYRLSFYRCSAKHNRMPNVIEEIGCNQSQISGKILENSIWKVLIDVLLDPQVLIDVLDKQYLGETNEELNNQITYLQKQIRNIEIEDEKLYRAYMADVFDENEYAAKRKQLKEKQIILNEELAKLQPQIMTKKQYEDKKQNIYKLCQMAKDTGIALDAPFEVKQQIIKTIVDKIILNVNENWYELQGVINGRFPIRIESNHNPVAITATQSDPAPAR